MANQTTPAIQIKDSNVGIGTTSPSSPFTVATDVRAASLNAADLRPQSQVNLLGGGGDSLFIGQLTNSFAYIQSSYFNTTLATYPILLNPLGGNVLIGTTTDNGNKLRVQGTTWISGNVYTNGEQGVELAWTGNTINDNRIGRIRPISTSSQNPYAGGLAFDYYKYDGAAYNFFEGMRLNGSGQLLINATSSAYGPPLNYGYNLGVKGIAGQAFISIARSTQTLDSEGLAIGLDTSEGAIYLRDNLPLSIYTNNTFAMRIAAGGNVLIGTTTDAGYKLDVNGTFRSQGTAYFSGNVNFSNQYRTYGLPYFEMGGGGITDEYLLLVPKYVSGTVDPYLLMGELQFQRGSTSTGNDNSVTTINIQTAYNQTNFYQFSINGATVWTSIDIISVSGVQWYALKARTSGGGPYLVNQFVGNLTDSGSQMLTRVRLSDAGVSLVTANVFLPSYTNYGGYIIRGTSYDSPYFALKGDEYTLVEIADRTSGTTDVGFIGIYSENTKVIDIPGNSDKVYFNNGGNFLIGTTTDPGAKLNVNGETRATSFTNAGALGTGSNNARNHFTQLNAGTASPATGWIAAAFGDALADRIVIGQWTNGAQQAIFGAHTANLNDWADTNYISKNHKFYYNGDWSIPPALTINTSGNVLIGTSTDNGAKLNVNGTSYINGAASFGSTIDVNGNVTLTQDTNDLIFQQTNSSTHGIVWKNTSYTKDSASIRPTGNGAWATQGIGFYTGNAGDSTTAPSLRFNIQAAGDSIFYNYVGVGTTSPSNGMTTSGVTIGNLGGGYGFIELSASDVNNYGPWLDFSQATGADYKGRIRYWTATNSFKFYTNESATELVTFTANNVLIGTTTDAGYKLDVNGTGRIQGNLYTTARQYVQVSGNTLMAYKIPYNGLSNVAGTTVSDSQASNGTAMVRYSTEGNNTFFYGPYTTLEPGNYVAKFRIKVASNASASYIGYIDVSGTNVNGQDISLRPNMFPTSGDYYYIDVPFTCNGSASNIEFRWIDWITGITDTYLDHVLVTSQAQANNVYVQDGGSYTIYEAQLPRLKIQNGSGNVGIGTTSPQRKLHVVDTAAQLRVSYDSATDARYSELSWGGLITYAGNTNNGMTIGMDGGNSTFGHIYFYTGPSGSSTEKMRITQGGNVLIGTTTDAGYKLRVVGSSYTTGDVVVAKTTTANANFGGPVLSLGDSTSEVGMCGGIAFAENLTSSLANVTMGIYYDGKANKMHFTASSDAQATAGENLVAATKHMTITRDTGNVGIGTTAPNYKLEVSGTGFFAGVLRASVANTFPIRAIATSGGVSRISFEDNVNQANDAVWVGSEGYNLCFGSSFSEQARISSSGNLIIGSTTDAGYKLDVHGEILGRDDIRILNTYALILNGTDANWRIGRNTITDSGWLTGNTMQMVVFGGQTGQGFQVVNTNGTALFEIDGVAGASRFTNALGVGVNPSGTAGRIDASNDIVAYSTSDQRLKENITPIANALDKVKALTGVEFDWKEETKAVHGYEGHDVGVIAQDVQAVLPEAVRTNDSGYLSVRYEKMIALLVEANKELASRVEELEKKLK